MADKVSQSSVINLEYSFYDGDTRTVSVENPRSDVTVAQLLAVGNVAKTTQAIIGDKNSAACVGLSAAETLKKTVTNFDLR